MLPYLHQRPFSDIIHPTSTYNPAAQLTNQPDFLPSSKQFDLTDLSNPRHLTLTHLAGQCQPVPLTFVDGIS
ncbi:hypothetical protein MJO28_009188 [Puccinia striiformis f. sp. tritici]|uniref:Uncharacterized protein n=1 Tax=Puccinia striiformis f. sp. tritici TaxID=168172 RepID=A0ACC0E6D4_9BASI|nr:hypothetical protein MJO28_009188 [Puccinia striiformis f. sp. tritici]KAI9615948.1 hypothetical protein H4Q26_011200 [Puccinia striiformis f. sp. tritici PST-130]KAI9625735.1 hypothetical protein KEM48_010688 [Puccinia striiformis f. sp. tritici PST-130]